MPRVRRETAALLAIPDEIVGVLSSWLEANDVCALVCTCRALRAIETDEDVWSHQFQRRFPEKYDDVAAQWEAVQPRYWFVKFRAECLGFHTITVESEAGRSFIFHSATKTEDAAIYSSISRAFARKTGYHCDSYCLRPSIHGSAHAPNGAVLIRNESHLIGERLLRMSRTIRKLFLASTRQRSHQIHHNPITDEPAAISHSTASAGSHRGSYAQRLSCDRYRHCFSAAPGAQRHAVNVLQAAHLQLTGRYDARFEAERITAFVTALQRHQTTVWAALHSRSWKCTGVAKTFHPLLSFAASPTSRLSLSGRWQCMRQWLRGVLTACVSGHTLSICTQQSLFTTGGPHLLYSIYCAIAAAVTAHKGVIPLIVRALDAPSVPVWTALCRILAAVCKRHSSMVGVITLHSLVAAVYSQAVFTEAQLPLITSAITASMLLCSSAVACRLLRSPQLLWRCASTLVRCVVSVIVWRALSRQCGAVSVASAFASCYTAIGCAVLLLLRLRWHSREELFE